MRYLVVVLLMGFMFCESFGQNLNIMGRIVDESFGEPIIGAYVSLDSLDGVLSDRFGNFRLAIPACEACTLRIIFLGFVEVEMALNPSEFKNGQIDLGVVKIKEKATQLREVMISGSQAPYRGAFEGTNYFISPKVLKEIQPLATEEVLRAVPGVNIVGDMGLSNRPNISVRGSWGRRSEKVLMLEDGSPISPAPYIAPGVYYNPISDRIDAIEVYTGADILQYGPNNMFGVINYITPKAPQRPTLRTKIAGGQRGFFSGLMSYGGTWNKVGAVVEGVYKRFDGFVQNSSVEMLNLNAKIFAELSESQSLYFKVSTQIEDNKATLASITPLTFSLDPTQNPFDADRFTMHRYGVDVIHRYASEQKWQITSKLFASDFARDWWRQVNAIIPAFQAFNYLGEQAFTDRYSYLQGVSFNDGDVIRVGRVTNGRESTTDSRWHFTVVGVEETFKTTWSSGGWSHNLDINAKLHRETYKDMLLQSDSTRWARSGQFTRDIAYELLSFSSYIRYKVTKGNFSMTPILRNENVQMNRQDRLVGALDPTVQNPNSRQEVNRYSVWLPGITLAYNKRETKVFASAYQGYIAPSKNFAFLVERDGVITAPDFSQEINMRPELNFNIELGARGTFVPDRVQGQIAVFNNIIRNFYLAGWNEFFNKLGRIQVRGLESSLRFNLIETGASKHRLSIQPNLSWMQSKVLSGEVVDRQLFTQIVHSDATKMEFVENYNNQPHAYRILIENEVGQVQVHSGELHISDLDNIRETTFIMGSDGILNAQAPYTPEFSFFLNTSYEYKNMVVGITWNYIGSQYTEFANFKNESSDGAIGRLDAFQTWDFNLNYNLFWMNKPVILFLVGKNIQNRIFRMSRLNRANSGIFPGGFRQINLGVQVDF